MNQKLAACPAADDRAKEFNFNGLAEERLEELPVPAAGTVTVGIRDSLPGLIDRTTVAAVIGCMNGVALAPQVPAADVRFIQSVQPTVQVWRIAEEKTRFFQRARADTVTATRFHHLPACFRIHVLIQRAHHSLNAADLLLGRGQRWIDLTGLHEFIPGRAFRPSLNVLLKELSLERHDVLPFHNWAY